LGKHFQWALQEGFKRPGAAPSTKGQGWPRLGAEDPNHLRGPYEEPLERIQDSPPLPRGTQVMILAYHRVPVL
jgi:hypothetical protein